MNDIDKIITALGKVPEKKLLIIELLNRVTDDKGKIDYKMLAAEQPQVNLAVAEAKSYSRSTDISVHALKKLLMPKSRGEL